MTSCKKRKLLKKLDKARQNVSETQALSASDMSVLTSAMMTLINELIPTEIEIKKDEET